MKKLGLFSLALVLALGGLGVGYAMWSDTVTISGNVTTGTLDLVVENCSNTWVYKIVGPTGEGHGIEIIHDWDSAPHTEPDYSQLISSANATKVADDEIRVTIHNAFPLDGEGEVLRADFVLHYLGSIPVRVQTATLGCTGCACDYIKILYYEWDPKTGMGSAMTLPILGDQWHNCQYVKVVIAIDEAKLQADGAAAMGLSGQFNGTFKVVQWNEYVT
jgi:predicted ribosomally synthesized peptide with SipW-like signal peptide